MSQVNLKTARRWAGLLLMVVTALGPWFVDTHPATEATCSPPLVWVGDGYRACLESLVPANLRAAGYTGYCACLESLAAALGRAANLGESAPLLLVLCLPAVLPFFSTLFLLFGGERRGVWASHLAAWGVGQRLRAHLVRRNMVSLPGDLAMGRRAVRHRRGRDVGGGSNGS